MTDISRNEFSNVTNSPTVSAIFSPVSVASDVFPAFVDRALHAVQVLNLVNGIHTDQVSLSKSLEGCVLINRKGNTCRHNKPFLVFATDRDHAYGVTTSKDGRIIFARYAKTSLVNDFVKVNGLDLEHVLRLIYQCGGSKPLNVNPCGGDEGHSEGFYLNWSPDGRTNPIKVFASKSKADSVAKEMTARHGQTMFTLQAVTKVTAKPVKSFEISVQNL